MKILILKTRKSKLKAHKITRKSRFRRPQFARKSNMMQLFLISNDEKTSYMIFTKNKVSVTSLFPYINFYSLDDVISMLSGE